MELNEAILARGASGFVDVTVVMECSPTWLFPEQWGTHEYDRLRASAPVAKKPSVVVHAPLDATLEDVLQRAARDFRLAPAPDGPYGPRALISPRIGFVKPDDDANHHDRTNLEWPTQVLIAQPDGELAYRFANQVTFRELLVASALGLVEGDALQPYLIPRHPQGIGPPGPEITQVVVSLVHAAYAMLPAVTDEAHRLMREFHALVPSARGAVDDTTRAWFVWQMVKGLRKRASRRRRARPEKSE